MELSVWLPHYIALNAALCVGACVSWVLAKSRLRSRDQLWLNYCALALVVAATMGAFLPAEEHNLFDPPVKIWAEEEALQASSAVAASPVVQVLSVRADSSAVDLTVLIFFGIVLTAIGLLAKETVTLLRLQSQQPLVRKIGRVAIYASDRHNVPFAFWIPGRSCVVIPQTFFLDPKQARMALAHEIQHHRQGDTRWIFALVVLRSLCFFNPFVHLWARGISELQEYACDEALVGQNKVDSQAYARCLVETAQNTRTLARHPAGATGMALRGRRKHLKWRIEKMFCNERKSPVLGRPLKFASSFVLALLMTGTAWTASGAVGDRRVSMAQALEMAKPSGSDFPVVVNDEVVKQLNRMIATPEGRRWVSDSLARMKNVAPLMKAKFEAYSAPEELYAIPMVESGYKNLAQTPKKGTGAGIWQFIASTARIFKLKVNETVDERLDIVKETDAALRLLGSDRLRFDDWSLAILSFNAGEQNVQAAIDRTGSRDPWVLLKFGLKTDSDYLAKVNAAILILRNRQAFE